MRQDTFLAKLDNLRARARNNHEAIIQVKVPTTLRDKLHAALDADKLTVKDIILSAIEAYLIDRENSSKEYTEKNIPF